MKTPTMFQNLAIAFAAVICTSAIAGPKEGYRQSGGVHAYNYDTGRISSGTVNGTTYGTLGGKKVWFSYPTFWHFFDPPLSNSDGWTTGVYRHFRWAGKNWEQLPRQYGNYAIMGRNPNVVGVRVTWTSDGRNWKKVQNPKWEFRYEKPD